MLVLAHFGKLKQENVKTLIWSLDHEEQEDKSLVFMLMPNECDSILNLFLDLLKTNED